MFDDHVIIDAYSRADAIGDGILIDVTDTAKEAGFTCAVALTQEAWADCVAWSDATDTAKGGFTGQSESGRLWDVLWMTRFAIQRHRAATDRLEVRLYRVPPTGLDIEARPTRLHALTGPGDDGEQVITICLPHED
jgi:hypothetical protein